MYPSTSSGDLIADRRFNHAAALAAAGDFSAGCDVLRQALDLVEGWGAGWLTLGDWYQHIGRREEAVAAFANASRLDPEQRLGAGLRLAALGVFPTPDAMPGSYVSTLFDDYAPRFEQALLGRLGYEAPARLVAALDRLGCGHFARVLDLGCGTGLMGAALRERCDYLVGIDLSANMVKLAAARQIYDRLLVGDALALLATEAQGYDLIVAADMVPYVGALSQLFAAVTRVLAPDAVFAFSAERHDGEGFVLGETLRYRHAPSYVAAAAQAAGFAIATVEPATMRREKGAAVAGLMAVLTRPRVP